jgi:hypothetical protein
MVTSIYDTLLHFIENDTIADNSKKTIKYNISKLKKYNGILLDTNQLTEFLEDNFTHSSRHNALGVLIKYFKSIGNENLRKHYFDIRHKHIIIHNSKDKSLVLNGTSDDYLKRLEKIPDSPYKLVVWLAIKFPANRISDYTKLKYGVPISNKVDNFIDIKYSSYVVNSIVKTHLQDRLVHTFDKTDIKFVKSCLKGIPKGQNIFGDVPEHKRKVYINEISKEVGFNTFHHTRRLQGSDPQLKECAEHLYNLARSQGQSVNTLIDQYIGNASQSQSQSH